MTKLDMQEMKERSFIILKDIKRICEENNFRYTLIYGTLLGAVRHKGFIPWDDDVDIAMPRNDYERFIEYCKTHNTPFSLKCSETDNKYGYLFAKACDKNTELIEEYGNRWKCDLGLFVDIFPIDGLGSTVEEAQKNLSKTRFYRELLVAGNWKKYFKSTTNTWYIEPIRFAFFILSRFISPQKIIKKITDYYKKISIDDSRYAAIICGAYRNKEIMESSVYLHYSDLFFEKESFSCLKQNDEYLKKIYGNYLELPPEEKRVARHSFSVYTKY